jgi:hypothetical protein
MMNMQPCIEADNVGPLCDDNSLFIHIPRYNTHVRAGLESMSEVILIDHQRKSHISWQN